MPFLTRLDLREDDKPDEWVVLSPFTYQTEAGEKITVQRGFITDLASIPRGLRNVIDVNGISRSPAVVHDYLYCLQDRPRLDCDNLLVEMLRSRGASKVDCDTFFFGVRIGGQAHWDDRAKPGLIPGYDMVPDSYWLEPSVVLAVAVDAAQTAIAKQVVAASAP